MEWQDEGVVLDARPHGENGLIVSVLTRAHGRCAGYARGGRGKKLRGVLMPGNRIHLSWRARTATQLGQIHAELVCSHAGRSFSSATALGVLSAACALCHSSLPDSMPLPRVHDGLVEMMDRLTLPAADLMRAYGHWEWHVLEALGYGVEIEGGDGASALRNDAPAFVDIETGRAVRLSEIDPAHPQSLVAVPAFLRGDTLPPNAQDIAAALALSGALLAHHVLGGRALPPARRRLAESWPIGQVAA